MTRYHAVIAYDGSDFSGYQVQPGRRTVQAELERVLTKMNKLDVKVTASGRTDAGVHAEGQSIHFDSDLQMATWQWKKALNGQLPNDIVVKEVSTVADSFHARYAVQRKEYRYTVYCAEEPAPCLRNYTTHVARPLNLLAMREAAEYLLGTHDFSSFCAANTSVVDKIRTLEMIELVERESLLVFRFVGDGFLYNMVRIIVGTLLEVGLGKRQSNEMANLLAARNRKWAGKTAPPNGLTLWQVSY